MNQVRMIQDALVCGEVVEVASQLAALLRDLSSPRVVFKWSSRPVLENYGGVPAFCAAHPEMVN